MRIRDGIVYVSAPFQLPKSTIDNFIKKHTPWIEKNLKKVSTKIDKRKYEIKDNSLIYILGRPLTFIIRNSNIDNVFETDNYLIVDTTSLKYEHLNTIIYRYLYKRAEEIFTKTINKYLSITNKSINKLVIKNVTSYNGKCYIQKRIIILNINIIHKDISYIEAICLHEIAHLEVSNHQKEFYDYIYKFMPDYKKRIKRR